MHLLKQSSKPTESRKKRKTFELLEQPPKLVINPMPAFQAPVPREFQPEQFTDAQQNLRSKQKRQRSKERDPH